jgi:hypothetical protein
MRPLGQVSHQMLEIVRNAAGRGVLRVQLVPHPRHLFGEAGRKRLHCLLF